RWARPRVRVDGCGCFVSPPATARPVAKNYAARATAEHPPGFYGPVDSSLAVNALGPGDKLARLDFTPLQPRIVPLAGARTIDLRAALLTLAVCLLLIDTVASL